MATRDLNRLAKRVKAHRMELYSSRLAAADAVGVSKDTWQKVEEGLTVREQTYAKIDKALGWATGSCVAIAEGGEPAFAGESLSPPPSGVVKALSPTEARQAVWDAARAKLPDAPIGQLDAFSDELVEILRRAGAIGERS
ncbi:helix-turn-helix domain-containing protein [Streptomyces sp. NPDC091383]|uniref:helix-turn-helix domain-containing protein n=1 Tax=Streptomyces sp. NPDC091383 TaxID=3365996 RepID=UPI003815D687